MAATVTVTTGTDFPQESVTPPLDDVVRRSVDFKGRPAVRSKSGRWKSASFIIAVEMAERMSYFSISSNLVSYLTGPLGQSTAQAAANVNAWCGAAWLLPLFGALVADSFFGRYRMIIIATLLYTMGLGFLSLSAALHSFEPQNVGYSKGNPPMQELIFFFLSLYLTAIAQGGNKPCILTFGADQFDEDDEEEAKAKSALFNWWNFFIMLVVEITNVCLNYVQDNLGWGLAFGIPCLAMLSALVIFLLGTMTYRFPKEDDRKSVISQVVVEYVKRWRGGRRQATLGSQLESYDKPLLELDDSYEDENKCHDNCNSKGVVETILRLLPIWCTCLGYGILYAQAPTLFVKQAATMDRRITSDFKIPIASIQSCRGVAFFMFIPIYTLIFVPLARSITKIYSGITPLQRTGTGIFMSLCVTIVAACVENKRLAMALEYGLVDTPKVMVPMSVWWLAPQYLILGITEVFTFIGLQEFFYDQVPRELRSIGYALFLSVVGVGELLSSLLVSVVAKLSSGYGEDGWLSDNINRAHLDYFYWLLTGLSAFCFAIYVLLAKNYKNH